METMEKAVLVGLYADSMEPAERSTDESMDELEYDKLAQCAIESLVSSGRVIHLKGANTDE